MDHKKLPPPINGTEEYLAAVLLKLTAVHASLDGVAQLIADGVEILRPPIQKEVVVVATPLPLDFPGCNELIAAGYDTLEKVPKAGKELTAIEGIGVVTANKILVALHDN